MAPDHPVVGSGPSLSPEEVAHRGFASAFRGFDPAEVRAFLERVATEMRGLRDRFHEAERHRKDAENRAAHPHLDEDTLASALGAETSRILRSAQEAGADIRAKAEDNAEKVLTDAHAEAARLKGESEGVLAKRTAEADRAAASIREAAEAWAEQVRARAADEAEQLLSAARDEGRGILDEAQSLRGKVLGDLARRRKVGHVQVEQLRVGRERLLDAYRVVRRTLDEVTEELQRAEVEARAVAENAAARMSGEPEASMEEMEAAILSARDARPPANESAQPAGPGADSTGSSSDAKPADRPSPDSKPAAKAPVKGEVAGGGKGEGAELSITAPVSSAKPVITSVTTTPPRTPSRLNPPVTAEPAAEPGDDRRLSSLRILRRGRHDASKDAPANVGRGSEGEGIRIIRSAEPEPAGESSSATTEVAEAKGTTAAPAPPSSLAFPDRAPEPVPLEPTPVEPSPADPGGEDGNDVDQLFARLRAGRESATDAALQVVADAVDGGDVGLPSAAVETPAGPGEDGEATDGGAKAAPKAAAEEGAVAAPAPDGDPVIPDGDELMLQRRDEVLDPVERHLARRLKRALHDDQNDLLDRLRKRGRAKAPTVLGDEDSHIRRFAEAGREHLVEAAKLGAESAGGATTEPSVDDLAVELGSALSSALRAKLESALVSVEAESDDEPAAADRVGVAYREWKSARIERLAGDHLVAAFARGVLAAAPAGAVFRWVVSDLDGPCPDCDDNALAGPTAAGEPFPTGQLQPPAHTGCRCLLATPGS